MKKLMSFLLALVMVVSMLPVTAAPVAAAEAAAVPTGNTYYSEIVAHESFDDINVGMTRGKAGSPESLNYITQAPGGARFRTGTPDISKNGEVAIAVIPATDGDFEVSFIADFTKLEVGAAGNKAGFSVDVRVTETTLRCRYIFSADESGNVCVTMEHAKQRFDTGIDVGAADVDVRIVVDKAQNASVMVNGRYVGRFGAPTAKGSAGAYYFALYCDASNAGANDVTVYDLQLAKTPNVFAGADKTLVQESFDNINSGMTKGKLGSAESRNYITQVEGGARIRTGVPNAAGNDEVAIASGLTIPEKPSEITFTANFTDLVVVDKAESTDGFSVDVRLGSVDGKGQRNRYVFNADTEGNIYVSQYDETKRAVRYDTGLDLPAAGVAVRIVADEQQNTTVQVNGRSVAKFTKSAVPGVSEGCFIVYCGASNRSSDARINDVTLYDLRLAQAVEMQAYYTYLTPTINGALAEKNWSFDNGGRIALLSDENYLYVALKTSNPAPKFTINGVTVTADPAAGTVTTANGKWGGVSAKSSSYVEVQIPLKSVLGLDYAPGQKVYFDYVWGTAGYTGPVVLAGEALVSYQGFEDYVRAGSGEVYFEQPGNGASTMKLKSGTLTSGGASVSQLSQIDTVDMDFERGFELEFTADFTSLMVANGNTQRGAWYDAGFSVELRVDPCRRYAFHSDASGNIYVTQRMAAAKNVARVDTGLNVGAADAHVRLVTADNGVTTIYINGANVGSLAAPDWALPDTGGRGYYVIYNSTKHRNTDYSQGNDVTLHNVVLRQSVPDPRVVDYPLASDANVDVKAYLNTSVIKMDGVPGEAEWYLSNVVAGTGNAPGGMVGINWGDGNLYVGGETVADTVTVTLNGKKVTASLKPAPSTAAGTLAVSTNGFEWVIPLEKFNLQDNLLERVIPYTLALSRDGVTASLTGQMTFSGEQILFGEPGRNYTAKEYVGISGQGHVTWERTDDGVSVTSQGVNNPKCVGGTFAQERYAVVDYDSGAFTLEVDLTINELPAIADVFGQRGLVFQLWSDQVQAPMALYNDGKDNVMMAMRYHYGDASYDTGLNIGDSATIRVEVDAKRIPTLYVNGKLVHTFTPFDRRNVATHGKPLPNFVINPFNGSRKLNDDGTLDGVNVVLHKVLLTQSPFVDAQGVVDAALDLIGEDFVVAQGTAENVSALNLPKQIYLDVVGTSVDVAWTAIDKLTGRAASGVDMATGMVSRGTDASAFNLTARVSYNGAVGEKTIALQVAGTANGAGTVGLIVDDANPASGVVTDWNGNYYTYFDTTHNSIVINRGASSHFNTIRLYDSDGYSRVSARHLGVFVSNDGRNWTKVNGWLLHQDGRTYTLYNLDQTARYVKVHTYHDDMDVTGEKPSFYNKVADMIAVSDEKYLPGARGKFAKNATFTAVNETAVEKVDTPVFVSLTDLGAKTGEYREGCPDFRFTIGSTTLAHWYNGTDGFYVRVPSIPAKGSTAITAHWGSKTALNFSDGEATFEVTYGNVALIDLSKETFDPSKGTRGHGNGIGTHGRPFTFPNGDVIVVSRQIDSDADIAVYRSTDGGHTFNDTPVVAYNDAHYKSRGSGFGGFLWDESVGDKGRLYLITYNGKVGNATDYRIVLTYSDDYGYTWSEPEFLNLPNSELVQKSNAGGGGDAKYQVLGNSGAYFLTDTFAFKRVITYCDGLKMENADGPDKPGVDYVIIIAGEGYEKTKSQTVQDITDDNKVQVGSSKVTSLYSTDGGKTWNCANNAVGIEGLTNARNPEDGVSEAGFAQLNDGSLLLEVRSQMEGNYYMHECVSTDFGKTWSGDFGRILSSNTSPVLTKYGDKRLMTWAACNGLSQISYRRTPMHVGISSNDYQSFDKILDVTMGTSFDSLQEMDGRHTQPGIAISPDGKNAFISYFDHCYFYHVWDESMYEYVGTVGMLIEDFDQMMNKTKGAWDDFENSSLKFQGWLNDRDGTIMLSREQAVSGKQSMKVLDENMGAPTHALRQIPSAKSGTVGAKLMVPKSNEAPFVMELKAAYNYEHMKFTVAALYVTPAGGVGYVDAKGVQHELTRVVAGSWNDYALAFDVASGVGELYVNGKSVGTFVLPSQSKDVDLSGNVKDYAAVHGVTAVSFNQAAGTSKNGDCLYVDDFFVSELATVARTLEESDAAQTTIGRFMTIVKKIIEVNGEQVELVEWGWVPGL